jgi:hypothetical protein
VLRYRIRNWNKFQHFKDRKPPWVKLYRDILDDRAWHRLNPEAAKTLVMLWLIASESDGWLPEIEDLAFRLRTTENTLENILLELSGGWLEQGDISLISDGYQDDAPETEGEREEEIEGEEEKFPPTPPSPDGDEGSIGSNEQKREPGDTPAEYADAKPKRERKSAVSLKTWVDACKNAGEKPISEYKPLLEYAEGVKLPMDYVQLCWNVFKREHLPEGGKEARRQKDWRRHFLNYVEKGYYKLWFFTADGRCELTSVGKQAQRFHDRPNREAA